MKPKSRHYRQKVPIGNYSDVLLAVVDVKEAAALVHVHPRTILYHIDKGNVTARKTSRTWLISVPSLQAYYAKVRPEFKFPETLPLM